MFFLNVKRHDPRGTEYVNHSALPLRDPKT